MTAMALPLVPIISFLNHWDHHWYLWLPGDPVYEAVEVLVGERGSREPLLWVFLTERAPPKRQINYYNDQAAVAASKATGRNAHFASIRFAISGSDGAPRGVAVSFDDERGRPIAIDVAMDATAKLSTKGAGLTDQIGHSGSQLLLIFFRGEAAYAASWRGTVRGVEVSKPQGPYNFPAPFPTAYSKNIFVGGFPFSSLEVSFDGDAPDRPRQAASFKPSANGGFEANNGQLRLVTTADGSLERYRQHDWTQRHVLDIGFDPPLPSVAQLAATEQVSRFAISLDGFPNLLTGEISARRQGSDVTLDWHFEEPAWARAKDLRATAAVKDDAVMQLKVRLLTAT